MDPSLNFFTGKYNEDEIKFSHLHKPLSKDHHARHPRPKDPMREHVLDYADMLTDHHHDIMNTVRYFAKGAVAGAIIGITAGPLLKRFNPLAIRKISQYMRDNTFGRLEVYRDLIIPYVIGGGLASAGYYTFYYQMWTKNSGWSPFWDQVIGYGIYSSVLTTVFLHPSHWYMGFYAGAAFGLCSYYLTKGNLWGNRSTKGYTIELPGMTEEERAKQTNRDFIHALSMTEAVTPRNLINL